MPNVPALPSFEEFHAAVNAGREPFPWQSRLAACVADSGWPTEIGVPTGLGKTTCLDIAVWALASQADRPPNERTLPTRTWYVVNRRLLVDAAFDRGSALAELLAAAHQGQRPLGMGTEAFSVIGQIAERLASIRGVGSAADPVVFVTRLRGGADLGARPPDPSWPALIFATVPMFGSSWLFRGYASSASTRPIDAAHAGTDALVLLDEAHLSAPLLNLRVPLDQCDVGDSSVVLPRPRARPQIVSLTATGDADDPFVLDDADRQHPVVNQRINAAKPMRLEAVDKRADALASPLAQIVETEVATRTQPIATVVFVNTAVRAREVFDEIKNRADKPRSSLRGAHLVLLTGRMRSREAGSARQAVLDPANGAPSGRDPSLVRDRHLVVVATQTLEVGADLDFDLLVTESCGTRALVQRLGRLNRLGGNPAAAAVMVHPRKEREWPLYGTEPTEVWDRLTPRAVDGVVDLSPQIVNEIVGTPSDQPNRVPELLPGLLWEWAKTSRPPEGEAPVNLYFEGFADQAPTVAIAWRATRFSEGERLIPSISEDEAIQVPLWEARECLSATLPSGSTVQVLDRRDRVTLNGIRIADLRPGDTVLLHVDDGLYDDHGWAPSGKSSVLDLSLERWPGIPLDLPTLRNWLSEGELPEELSLMIKELHSEDQDVDLEDVATTVASVLRRVEPRPEIADAWGAVVDSIPDRPTIDWIGRLPVLERQLSRGQRRATMLVAADAFDDLSADVRSVALSEHLESVGDLARRIAQAVGLPDELVDAVEAAGRFHDLGKNDPRFQHWLDPRGEALEAVAKSSTPRWRWRADREAAGWPQGGRHEALSGRLVEAWLDSQGQVAWDRDLVIHLAVSHHGFGRPLIDPVDDREPTRCTATIGETEVSVSGDLSSVDWDQPARFRSCCERYGYWGLALLEAIVRQADWLASGQAEVA